MNYSEKKTFTNHDDIILLDCVEQQKRIYLKKFKKQPLNWNEFILSLDWENINLNCHNYGLKKTTKQLKIRYENIVLKRNVSVTHSPSSENNYIEEHDVEGLLSDLAEMIKVEDDSVDKVTNNLTKAFDDLKISSKKPSYPKLPR